nr:hypothetical protein BaRGS_015548 [Batillaria attramentaria]
MEGLLASLNISTVLIFLVVFLIGYRWLTTPKNLPPGPPGLPLVGNMLSFLKAGPRILELLHEWHVQYGDVFTITMGDKRVLFSEGPKWKELRRVTLMTMRDFGMGKKTIEERIQDEARAVMGVLDIGQGQPICMKPLLTSFTSNIICSIIFGKRFDYDDPVFKELTSLLTEAVAMPVMFLPVNFLSCLRFLPAVKRKVQEFIDAFLSVDAYLEGLLKDHEETFDPDNIRDFVDLYIKTSRESEDKHLYTARNMRRVILDLFGAGTETTSTTLDWLVLYMVAYPDVQKRCQKEIDESRLVTMADRSNLPYIEAVLTEMLRCVPIAPVGVPHVAVREGKVGGYTVPVNTIIMPNIGEIHKDPVTWTDPDTFRPERFLDQDGKFQPPKDNYIPFSLGPRVCLGEALAKMDLFILFSSLIQFYTFTMDKGRQPNLKGNMGITYSAVSQPVLATRR